MDEKNSKAGETPVRDPKSKVYELQDVVEEPRIDAIVGVEVSAASRLVSGTMMRGRTVRIQCRSDGFASQTVTMAA